GACGDGKDMPPIRRKSCLPPGRPHVIIHTQTGKGGVTMPIEAIVQTIAKELRACPFLKGVVLGGSRATGCATESSDIDVGLYYEGTIDYGQLNAIAQRLDDAHRENLVCREGEWGNWVNCGGWLVINGVHVDWILRDCARVKRILASSETGQF